MNIKKLKGKLVNHIHLGKCIVTGIPNGSRVKVEIECIDRGPGWNEETETYTGTTRWFKDHVSWSRGENRQFGDTDVVHKNSLTL